MSATASVGAESASRTDRPVATGGTAMVATPSSVTRITAVTALADSGISITRTSAAPTAEAMNVATGLRSAKRPLRFDHADHLAWRLQLADSQIAALAEERRDQVRLGACPTALAGFVPSAIVRLRLAQGDLRVLLSEVTPSTLESRFLSGEFDVAVGYQDATTERREFQGAQRIDLLQDSFLVGLPSKHRLAGATGPVSLAELAEDDWIVASTEGFLTQACRDAGFEPRIVATTSDPLATRGLIARGLGVGWVPSLLIDDYSGIVIRPVKDQIRRRDVYALLPPGDRHPLAKHVLDALIETATELKAAA